MRKITLTIVLAALCGCTSAQTGLKDTFKDDFLIGAALNSDEIEGHDEAGLEILKKQQLYCGRKLHEVGGNPSGRECL